MKRLVGCCLFLLIAMPGIAQFYPTQYRPPDLNWQQLRTPHFRVVFPAGEDSVAWQTARILEHEYNDIQDLTDGTLSNFPVILNNYNDRSNGFVTSLHFRSEIEIPPIKGKSLNPQTGGWLENVAPHELVHALQFSNTGGFGLGGLVNLFSPDLARSFHGAIPSGITEGLATYYETKSVAPGGGRGNHPFFYNQFNALFDSPERWSMGQTMHVPERTRPFNRHYIGGYEFTSWLQQAYGDSTSRDALNFYIDLPFLGYGVALKHATGKWPAQLYDDFVAGMEQKLTNKNTKPASSLELDLPFDGASVRSPKWIDNSTLIFYGSFYNAKAGFYRYSINENKINRVVTTNSVGDFIYDLSKDKSRLLYASYRSSPIYDNTFKAELVEVELAKGQSNHLTTGGRLYAPSFLLDDEDILALQTNHASSRLVRFNKESKSVEELANPGGHQIVQLAVNPVRPEQLAVVVNKQGLQALWIVSKSNIREGLKEPPAISFINGSVFDPSWHPDGDKLLFTSDHTGVMNIYEFNLEDRRLLQITDTAYNAFEPSYSPDGTRIAFIFQKGNEQLPALLPEGDFYDRFIDPALWKYSPEKDDHLKQPDLGHDINTEKEEWEQSDYSGGLSWLKPRTVIPLFEEVGNSGSYEFGASLHSSNLLQNQSYSLGVTGFEDRLWYDLTYRNKTFFPGFKISSFSEPAVRTLAFVAGQDTVITPLVRQERSFALSIPIRVIADRNIYFTSFTIEPEIRRSQIRFLETGGGSPVTDFANLSISNIFTSFNYRLQQNIRDVQPNTGISLFGEVEHFLSSGDLTFNVAGRQATRSFVQPTGLRGGMFAYLSTLRRWNQSLRVSLLGITQTDPVFDNQFLASGGFSEPVFPTSNNLLGFNTRYTIPVIYPDDGGFLLPLYLSNVYLVAFSSTVADASAGDPLSNTRSVFGAGIRAQFRLSNLSLDLGIGFGFEPTRNNSNFFIGNF